MWNWFILLSSQSFLIKNLYSLLFFSCFQVFKFSSLLWLLLSSTIVSLGLFKKKNRITLVLVFGSNNLFCSLVFFVFVLVFVHLFLQLGLHRPRLREFICSLVFFVFVFVHLFLQHVLLRLCPFIFAACSSSSSKIYSAAWSSSSSSSSIYFCSLVFFVFVFVFENYFVAWSCSS